MIGAEVPTSRVLGVVPLGSGTTSTPRAASVLSRSLSAAMPVEPDPTGTPKALERVLGTLHPGPEASWRSGLARKKSAAC